MKKCSKCKKEKDTSLFYKHRKTKDKLYPSCKVCQKEYSSTYVKSKIHRDYNSEYQKSEKYKEYAKKYYKEYRRVRYATDPQYRIANNLRKRLRDALKGNWKVGSAVRDLGCSIHELKSYLTKQFTYGMTWENYGEWHIDHIKPLSKFDLTNRVDLLQAVHYTNLQPLWAKENISKGNR